LIAAHQTGLLEYQPAIAENGKVGDALNPVTIGEFGIRFRIDFEDDRSPGHLLRNGLNLWRSGATGSAPRRPEIDQHRDW
jgi:hypothetical protein